MLVLPGGRYVYMKLAAIVEYLSLPRCPFVWGEVLTATSSPPLYLVLFFQSPSSPAFLTSLLAQSSILSLGLPRLILPCSHNSAALFGSLSSVILNVLPTAVCSSPVSLSSSSALMYLPLTPQFFSCLPSLNVGQ